MNAITNKDEIISFLRGLSKDYKGRSYDDLVNQNDIDMEKCHDAIQYMFCLHEFSRYAHTCPIISPEIVNEAVQYQDVIDNILKAKERMEKFLAIGKYEDRDKQRKWCRNYNHNLLRVTRVIRCLRLFGLKEAALDFYEKVKPVGEHFGISDFTLRKWDSAYTDDVWNTLQ